ncbi:hypothetical protein HHI36_015979 [Cryptolaemus montrouzieri]|uniref:Uncharacterized protein n=1 Tax=Cryptolaemus montrouzieri TaxID=559131 RepID=A0ABD2N7G0_9CUCU
MDRSTWRTSEDIRRSLFEYSDIEYPGDTFASAPSKSIAEYRARTSRVRNPGIFDDTVEDVEIFLSGRGKYNPGRIITPGIPVDPNPEDDLLIQRKIRQVSGLGYSNELIESTLGNKKKNTDGQSHDLSTIVKDIQLNPQDDMSKSISSTEFSPVEVSAPSKVHVKIQHQDTGKKKKKKKFNKWFPDMEIKPQNEKTWVPNFNFNHSDSTRLDYFPPLK